MTGVLTLLVILSITLLVNRIASTALTMTGMSREMARFQARSAFSTVGFTTSEAESVVNHPVRRRIISLLMLSGNVGFVSMIAVGVGSFTGNVDKGWLVFAGKVAWLIGGMVLLWLIAASKWVDDQLFRLIRWMLITFSSMDIQDYTSLLQLSEGYSVTKVNLGEECWLIGLTLGEARLSDMGVNVLGIRRADKNFVGTPIGVTYFRKHDGLIIYGNRAAILELDQSLKEEHDFAEHKQRLEERRKEEGASKGERE